jgi:FAD binding domain of DNA photolyase
MAGRIYVPGVKFRAFEALLLSSRVEGHQEGQVPLISGGYVHVHMCDHHMCGGAGQWTGVQAQSKVVVPYGHTVGCAFIHNLLLMWCTSRFFALKHGNAIFKEGGTIKARKHWSKDRETFERWRDGLTGMPLVDANMRELKATGEG